MRRGRLTETSRFNLLLELNGRLYTPPDAEVFSGLARRGLLSASRVFTRNLTVSDLAKSSRVLLINSVRGPLDITQVVDPAGETIWTPVAHPRA